MLAMITILTECLENEHDGDALRISNELRKIVPTRNPCVNLTYLFGLDAFYSQAEYMSKKREKENT